MASAPTPRRVAEAALREALALATKQDEPPLQWRIHLVLNRLYQAQERRAEAEREVMAAQAIIEDLTGRKIKNGTFSTRKESKNE